MSSIDDSPSSSSKVSFDSFYQDLKETEKKDSVLTPKQQIDRLLRPGATYRNLNPFEVRFVITFLLSCLLFSSSF